MAQDLAVDGAVVLALQQLDLNVYRVEAASLDPVGHLAPPRRTVNYNGPWELSALCASEGRAFVTGCGGILAVDLQDPERPEHVGVGEHCTQCLVPWYPTALAARGGLLYLAVDPGPYRGPQSIATYRLDALPDIAWAGRLQSDIPDSVTQQMVVAGSRLLAASDYGLAAYSPPR